MKGNMKKINLFVAMIALCVTFLSRNAYCDVSVLPSKNKTSADIPLTFELERTEWAEGVKQLQLWGTVRNTGKKTFDLVTVIVAAYDSSGKFLGREIKYADPSLIKPGQVSYVNGFINTGKQLPVRLEYTVSKGGE